MKVPITKPNITESDFDIVAEVLKSGWVVQGPFVREFERMWSQFTGARNSIAVSNCTTALHLALTASGIQKGDEVIVPAFTWIATANAVEYTGAKPVFCDIDLNTFNIDVSQIERLITSSTRAIIPVHLFGLCADTDGIKKIAEKHGLKVIEDAACGFGAYKDDIHSGMKGDFGCFSFHPRKAITTGEGGMIITDDDKAALLLRSLRDHGAVYNPEGIKAPYLLPEFDKLGFNYRMTDIQAALGVAQMKRADEIIEKRRRIALKYDNIIGDIEMLKRPGVPEGYKHGYQSYVCLYGPGELDLKNFGKYSKQRNEFMQYLSDNNISTRPGTHALHIQKYYRDKYGLNPEDFPNSLIADRCSVALPVYPGMTEDEFHYTAESIKKYGYK